MPLRKEPLPNLPSGWLVNAAINFRQKLLSFASSLAPPEVELMEWSIGIARTKILHTLATLRVPDVLEEHGPLDGAALAKRIGTDADATHRMLRACVTMGLFAFTSDGKFTNNRLSRALLEDAPLSARPGALYWGSASNLGAWLDFENVIKTGKHAFERVFKMNVWEWFDAHPDERDVFAEMMGNYTTQAAPVVATIYPDFDALETLCDVAGGRGILLSEILLRHPGLRGILFDNPGVLALAKQVFAERGVASARLAYHPGSFFLPEIPTGADAYLMKNILHDWDDQRCVQILRNVRLACAPGAKLLIAEILVEHDDTHFGSLSDMQMMTVCVEGRERGREDFRRIMADGGFTLTRVFAHPIVSVLEGVAS